MIIRINTFHGFDKLHFSQAVDNASGMPVSLRQGNSINGKRLRFGGVCQSTGAEKKLPVDSGKYFFT